MTTDWIKVRRDLHQIPETGFREYKTQAYLLDFIETLPQEHITVEKWHTGLFVSVEGTEGGQTIAYRTDIDGLPIKEETGFDFASAHEGYMHACGHDLHMTIALGALSQVVQQRPKHHVLFLFQPAEEGPGGAQPMLESDLMAKYRPDMIFALHIDPRLPVGTVSSKPGLLFANTSELFIDFHGKGGHAAYPHETKDMIMAASAFNVQLQQLVSRIRNPLDPAVVTLGKMEAGTVQNIIAENARVEGTIRTIKPETMTTIKESIEQMLKGIELRYDCSTTVDYGANYYMVYNDAHYVEAFKQLIHGTDIEYAEAPEAMTGEDFGYFLKDISGFMFWLGVNSSYGLHHNQLNPDERAIEVGINAVTEMIQKV
ncbi:N-acetyldiaminopimelate deacetylase [Tenuibacillus multivorans]|uniref:N-acetyldiaminopimelate deacetylase n=1 Tax=Tenuibacillus multivorans TaxID=237069 RepID=A0A1G9YCG5_9BACI|nr:N-acetyldiaminopimelate deacetylase [Tenuibacillus multivorans]GEL76044.1 N-acetyldiaminopimelate deacetylase [Tenuibacillus multivorans]SDN06812.1 N-acetyldiaminopimelate deacetylase [Tenuibacillus multivorans]